MIRNKRERIVARISELERELEEIDRYPLVDNFIDGTVIRFNKQFARNTRAYTYAAIRVDGEWYLTGSARPRPAFTWAEFVGFLTEGHVSDVEIAILWADL